jgi:hypothetical protein
MDASDILNLLPSGSTLLDKGLILVGLYLFNSFGKKLDLMSSTMGSINKHIAVMFEKHERNDESIKENKIEIKILREKNHEIVNKHISKIDLNELRIQNLEDNKAK